MRRKGAVGRQWQKWVENGHEPLSDIRAAGFDTQLVPIEVVRPECDFIAPVIRTAHEWAVHKLPPGLKSKLASLPETELDHGAIEVVHGTFPPLVIRVATLPST